MAKPIIAGGDIPSATVHNEWFINVNWAYKTANQSVTNSTTLVVDSHLSVPVQANAAYEVTASLVYDGPNAGDLKLLYRCPTGASLIGIGNYLTGAAASQSDNQNTPVSANASSQIGCLAGGGTQVGSFLGVLRTSSTAGSIWVEWAQFVADATATRMLAGSFLKLDRVE